jgi:hypothetical protein
VSSQFFHKVRAPARGVQRRPARPDGGAASRRALGPRDLGLGSTLTDDQSSCSSTASGSSRRRSWSATSSRPTRRSRQSTRRWISGHTEQLAECCGDHLEGELAVVPPSTARSNSRSSSRRAACERYGRVDLMVQAEVLGDCLGDHHVGRRPGADRLKANAVSETLGQQHVKDQPRVLSAGKVRASERGGQRDGGMKQRGDLVSNDADRLIGAPDLDRVCPPGSTTTTSADDTAPSATGRPGLGSPSFRNNLVRNYS